MHTKVMKFFCFEFPVKVALQYLNQGKKTSLQWEDKTTHFACNTSYMIRPKLILTKSVPLNVKRLIAKIGHDYYTEKNGILDPSCFSKIYWIQNLSNL